ncbi:hypothetical protein MNBD_GAMMA24-451 [hydrothermal vent metagenome]|uniref:HTH luxR-type domain-containing protein n=1 Tax=hydrothermal vent metagenome TaxID=652676 RepID=A0A3B1BJF3_9ZZZZ
MSELKLKPSELKKLMRIMNDCLYAQSREDVLKIIDQLNEVIPFNSAILCHKSLDKGAALLEERVNHSYPDRWVVNYHDNKLFLLDPIIIASSNINRPFTWDQAYSKVEMSNSLRAFINAAEDFGLKEGVTHSNHTRQQDKADTLMSLETSGHKVDDEYLAIIEYILPHIHEVIVRIDGTARIPEDLPELTARERETLKWVYEGKTAWEIGVILSISERTVKFHLKNIYEKLDVKNRSQAVAKAVRYGIVW